MMAGAFGYRVPPAGWKPGRLDAADADANAMITQHHVHLNDAHKTPQFWLIWVVLCLNVSRRHRRDRHGLADAAGDLRRQPDRPARLSFNALDAEQKARDRGDRRRLRRPAVAVQHRRAFLLGLAVGLPRPQDDLLHVLRARHRALRVGAAVAAHAAAWRCSSLAFCIILSMYGGGFATVPAYLADMFGTQFVGAIHGRLLTAWSTAGILGPVVVNYMREASSRPACRATSSTTDHVHPGGMLVVGLHLQPAGPAGRPEVAHERSRGREAAGGKRQERGGARHPARSASAGAASTAKPRCSGRSSASRSPGASGSR